MRIQAKLDSVPPFLFLLDETQYYTKQLYDGIRHYFEVLK